jgi:hypothetical protein
MRFLGGAINKTRGAHGTITMRLFRWTHFPDFITPIYHERSRFR